MILHCGQSRSKSKLGVSTRVVLLCFGSRAFYVLHYRRWWLISYSIPIRLLAGFIAVRYRKLGREKNKYINYECNRYKWKTTNNMFISIKKIIYVALNICMSSCRVLNIEMKKKKLINLSPSGVGESRNIALLGRHVLGENFWQTRGRWEKAIVLIFGEPVLWTRMIGQ